MSALKEVLERAEFWPVAEQEKLVRAAEMIERNQGLDFELDDEDWKIIDARIAATARGEIASDEEVEALFSKYRAS